ncbi:transcriptional regulator [Streptomyces sp. NPDC057638]|uniref:transcriptional regulator n=1 Tax=Streptomyces sp. NPDC057638 TaxID=3346190 RepID=UPI00369C9E91
MTESLFTTYEQLGARHTRPMAATFLVKTVVPYLRTEGPAEVREAMTSAAAYLCYCLGWMAVDEGLQGLAQRYYVRGLELAGAGGDHLTYCYLLRGMSAQAVDLEHGARAVALADAAAVAAPESGPRLRAFFAGQQAHCYAVAGDRSSALSSMREAERAMDQAESSGKQRGYGPSTVAYHAAQVRYYLGDVSGSIESLESHFRLRGPEETLRSDLRFSSILAERQLEKGHLEAACQTWSRVLEAHSSVHSGRVDRHVASIGPLLGPYRTSAAARDVYERSRRTAI